MSPRIPDSTRLIVVHGHRSNADGGKIEDPDIARLDRLANQTFVGSVIAAGLRADAVEVNTSLTIDSGADFLRVANSFIHTLGMATMTDARTINDPDASGERVVSKPSLNAPGLTADTSGDVLANAEAGLYLVAVYVECTTAGLTGTLAVTITGTGGGGSCPQTVFSAFSLTAKAADSKLIAVYVASGGITYAATRTSPTGSPVHAVRIACLGRIA